MARYRPKLLQRTHCNSSFQDNKLWALIGTYVWFELKLWTLAGTHVWTKTMVSGRDSCSDYNYGLWQVLMFGLKLWALAGTHVRTKTMGSGKNSSVCILFSRTGLENKGTKVEKYTEITPSWCLYFSFFSPEETDNDWWTWMNYGETRH